MKQDVEDEERASAVAPSSLRAQALRKTAARLFEAATAAELFSCVRDGVAELAPSEHVSLSLRTDADADPTGTFEALGVQGPKLESLQVVHEALERGEMVRVEAPEERLRHQICLPLRLSGDAVGALTLARPEGPGFSPRELDALHPFGLLVASHLLQQRASSRAEEALRRAQTVLNNARDGLLLVTPAGRIAAHSQSLDDTLGRPAEDQCLWDWVARSNPEVGEALEVGWCALQDGFLPPHVALRQLPRSVAFGTSTLALEYRLADGLDGIREVVVMVRDVSEQREREAEKELVSALRHHARDPAGFVAFVRETDKLMASIERGEATALEIHTAKGNVAVVGAASVSGALHTLETAHATGSGDLSHTHATEAWERFKNRLSQIADLERGPGIMITVEEFEAFRSRIRAKAPSLLPDADAWLFELLDARLEKLAEAAVQVAERLGKPEPLIELDCEPLRLDPARYGPLWMALVHPIRNAVDHGIESAAERRAAGKPERGHLRIEGRRTGDGMTLVLAVEDDGAGMDWRMIAEAVGKLDLEAEVDGDDLQMALFLHPVSTKTEATDISGRGLGLSALHRVVQDLGGTIQIESTLGAGTSIRAYVPLAPHEQSRPADDGPEPGDRVWAEAFQAMSRHSRAVQRRVRRVHEKADAEARDAVQTLDDILQCQSLDEIRERILNLLMQVQRSDIRGQELTNISDAIERFANFMDDEGREREARLAELPRALEALLPRDDLDARDIPEPLRGPAIELFGDDPGLRP